jgi:hypothetical protein
MGGWVSGPRKFTSLRQKSAPARVSPEEPIEAKIKRALLLGDGPAVLAWLQDEAFALTPAGCSEAMLREAEGARRLVDKLMRVVEG